MTHLLMPLWLQAPAGQGCADPQVFLPFVAIAAVFYFVLFRPQQKQAAQHKQLIAQLKKGDSVVTQAGLFAKIHSVGEKDVVLDIGGGTKVRWLKSQISGVEKPAEETAEPEKKE
ncbi:MAG: preprotein translocase subunit YajC [Deltaproteobacteria bacterium]